MPLSIVHSRAQTGVEAAAIAVEVDLSPGLPSLSIVGLPETAVKESKDRVRSAILNGGFEFPARRITVNLAPADLPKEGSRFDLPIAVGILAAAGQLQAVNLESYEFIGELALGGALREVVGVLPSAAASGAAGRAVVVPEGNAAVAALARNATVLPAAHLLDVTAHLLGVSAIPVRESTMKYGAPAGPGLEDVRGQAAARRALEVAAAGRHHLLLAGPPGTGKTMLAERLPGILPPLDEAAALETASIWSLTPAGFDPARWRQRPFRSPHHSISAAALVGGGSQPRPGEVSLAHNGVLFLDELPEFGPKVLDQLREPLETGRVDISRVAGRQRYPARFQLVCAMNLCRCGRRGDPSAVCNCPPEQVQRYQSRVSGPLMDRIDIRVHVKPVPFRSIQGGAPAETSAAVAARVVACLALQRERQGCANAALPVAGVESYCRIDGNGARLLEEAMNRLSLSARAYHRVLRVARTIADLEGAAAIAPAHLAEAVQFRLLDDPEP